MRSNKSFLLPILFTLVILLSCNKKHEGSKDWAENTLADLANPWIDTKNPVL